MTKKLLIISLMLFGLIVGTSFSVSAQETVQTQSTTATPANPLPLISLTPVDSIVVPEMNLQPGVKNLYVKKVQEILKNLGYLPSDFEITEYFGPKTKEAIKNFQKANNLPATGFFGPATRNMLKTHLQARGATGRVVIDKDVDIVCMKTAVEKRENALLSAYDLYTSKLKTASEARKTDLLAAWSIQDPKERQTAVKIAWDKYRQNVKTATIEWNQSRKTVWTQFTQDAKNCKASAVETQDLEKVEVVE